MTVETSNSLKNCVCSCRRKALADCTAARSSKVCAEGLHYSMTLQVATMFTYHVCTRRAALKGLKQQEL
jgi:hypothetical protein